MNRGTLLDAGVIIGAVLIGITDILFYRILGEVNARSPAGQKIGVWWATLRFGAVLQRHRQLFPESKKRAQMWSLVIVVLSFCALVVVFVFMSER